MRSFRASFAIAAAWVAFAPDAALGQRRRDVITREEIEQSPKAREDLYQVIRSLRPHFLAPPRGVRRMDMDRSAQAGAAVYVGRNHLGGIDAMLTIPAADVEEVRYLDPSRAEAEFGLNGSGGAIVIKFLPPGKQPSRPPGLDQDSD
jgi:hypothetical protein